MGMEDNTYPKYQFSVFSGKAQFVVRSEEFDEFKEMLKNVDALVKQYEQVHGEVTPQNDVVAAYVANPTEKKFCAIHGSEMKIAISKKTGKPYWYHRVGKEMCFGKKQTY